MVFRIKEARQIAGISQKDLAAKMGISPGTLSGYESGLHDPKSDSLSKIADICGVSVDFLLGRTPKEILVPPKGDTRREVSVDEVEQALVASGFIKPGQDLSDDDLRFLISVGEMLRSWFA